METEYMVKVIVIFNFFFIFYLSWSLQGAWNEIKKLKGGKIE